MNIAGFKIDSIDKMFISFPDGEELPIEINQYNYPDICTELSDEVLPTFNLNHSFSLTVEDVDLSEGMKKLFSKDDWQFNETTQIKFNESKLKQCRTNRKFRINKKWAKKYGYYTVAGKEHTLSNCSLKMDEPIYKDQVGFSISGKFKYMD